MLRFTPRAVEDLASILTGMLEFRINNSKDPSLTSKHAQAIYDDILDQINTIPTQSIHVTNSFDGLEVAGMYVYTYKRNRTSWYAFYDRFGSDFVVNRISNNWLIRVPRL